MLRYRITIISKNKTSINKFFVLFEKTLKTYENRIKYLKKKQKIKVLTLLKSPHVNKTAQEQFESRLYIRQIFLSYSTKSLQILILLKKLKTYLFNDIKFKAKFDINNFKTKKTKTQLLNPNNLKLNFFCKKKVKNESLKNKNTQNIKDFYNKQKELDTQTKYLLKIFEIYGHFLVK